MPGIRSIKVDNLTNDGATLVALTASQANLKCYSALNTEVANATNLAAKSVFVEVIGQ